MERILEALETFKQQGRKNTRLEDMKPSPHIIYTRTRLLEVPLAILQKHRISAACHEGRFADAYKVLRAQVLHRMEEKGWNVLGITSPGEGEGKSLTAINLAISMTMDGHHTALLVDANLRNPSVHTMFGLEGGKGLVDYLWHDTPVEDLLIYPGIGRFTFLPGGRQMPNSAELLGSPKMAALADEVKSRYRNRVILYDLPSLRHAADVLAVSPCLDAVLMVVGAGSATAEDVNQSFQLLKDVPVIGTILNKG
jgi:capsular exopolysaccharide synthesis family protein